jgi:hypothetical protein
MTVFFLNGWATFWATFTPMHLVILFPKHNFKKVIACSPTLSFFSATQCLRRRKSEWHRDTFFCADLAAGLPDFSWYNIPKPEKNNKLPQNIPK